MEKEKDNDSLDIFRRKCREHKLKVTRSRELIYQELIISKDHPSPEMLFERVRERSSKISRDTVYRTLKSFHDMGLVDMVEGFTLTKRFDPNRDDHHHMRCTRCQAVVDFSHPEYDQMDIPSEIPEDFRVRRVRVTFEGLCRKCQSEVNGKK